MMSESENPSVEKTVPFYPDHITTEAKVAGGLLLMALIVGVIGTLRPVGLEAPADPMTTPPHAQPEWYFLFLYQMLKYVPKTAGVLLPIAAVILMMIWPLLDRKVDGPRAMRTRGIFAALALIVVLLLTALGMLS